MYLEYASEAVIHDPFLVVFLVVLHVSDPYSRTDFTLELTILILVWVALTDIEEVGYSWGEIERMAQDSRRWRTVVGSLCPGRV